MTDPGLEVRDDPVGGADAEVAGLEWTAPRVHAAIMRSPALIDALGWAVQDVAGAIEDDVDAGAAREALQEAGVDALEGRYRDLCIQALQEGDDARDRLATVSAQLGTGNTAIDVRSGRDDLDGGPVALFANSERSTPTVQVTLRAEFFDRRARHRRDVLDLLTALATGCRVVLQVTGYARRLLWERHRDQLPADVTRSIDPHRVGGGPSVEAAVERATTRLDPRGTPMAVLQALDDRPSEAASYRQLRSSLCLREGHARKVAERLADLGLVERLSRGAGRTVVSLTPAGRKTARRTTHETAGNVRHGGSTGRLADGGVTTPSHTVPDSRVTTRASTGEGEAPPADAAAAATAPTADDRRAEGYAGVERVPYADLQGAVATTADSGEVALVDAPAADVEDPRTPLWGYDRYDDHLVVGARATRSALQVWTTIARAVASRATFEDVVDDRLQDVLDEHPRTILERKRQVGGLGEGRAVDADRFRDYLLEWVERLCDQTRQYHRERDDLDDDEEREWRGEITRSAKGLVGTTTTLLDLAGVEVTRLVYVGRPGDDDGLQDWKDDDVDELARTLAHQEAIEATVDGFPLFRTRHEAREDRREFAIDPPDPERLDGPGSLTGSLVVVGTGIDRLTAPLRRRLSRPADVVDAAPDIGVEAPIRRYGIEDSEDPTRPEMPRAAVERAARKVAADKNVRVTDRAVDLLHQWTGTAFDVARALAALRREDDYRRIRVDEVRTALSALPSARLGPNLPRTAQDALKELLRSESALSQADLCRRADISTSSWRRHRSHLAWAGYVDDVEDGWRVALPAAPGEDEGCLPWTLDESTARSAVETVAEVFDVDVEAIDEAGDPVVGAVLRAARAGAGCLDRWSPSTVAMGRPTRGQQSALSRFDSPIYGL